MRDKPYKDYFDKNFLIYCKEISETGLLTKEEEISLARQAHDSRSHGNEARERLIKSNLRLVVNIAKGYRNYGMDVMDLVSEGNLGLIKAVDRFDVNRGVRFSTYATLWIKQSIRSALSNKSRLIRLPAHIIQLQSNILKFISDHKVKNSTEPTQEEIALGIGLPEKKVKSILELQSLNKPIFFDSQDLLDPDKERCEFIEDSGARNPAKEAEKTHDFGVLCELIEKLDDREKYIIERRFGVKNFDPQTLETIGKKFKISRERIRQIEFIALRKLRNMMTKKMKINFKSFFLTNQKKTDNL